MVMIVYQVNSRCLLRYSLQNRSGDDNGTNGGGGLFLACEDLGECSTIHSSPALLFFKVEISSRTLIRLFWPRSVHSGLAS